MGGDVGSLIHIIKVTYDYAKAAKEFSDDVDKKIAISDIVEKLLNVQEMALSIQAKTNGLEMENFELRKKLLEVDSWAQVESRYELKDLAPGSHVYGYKQNENNIESYHILCPSCFTKRKKSILQNYGLFDAGIRYVCHDCKFLIYDPSQKAESSPSRRGVSRYEPNW